MNINECINSGGVIFNRLNALGMNELAKTVFAPVYPVISRNAVETTGIKSGLGLELGCGPAMFSIAMAKENPDMEIIAMDFSEISRYIAEVNIASEGLQERIFSITGNVHALSLDDGCVDLVFSRGSMFFWNDLKMAFSEIYRILSPGGATYIGGGFGNRALEEEITGKMRKLNPEWSCHAKRFQENGGIKSLERILEEITNGSFMIINDDSGIWIVLSKPA
jgi:ubiquinone/menaquinone biosynthesis C-methylase UbiE